MRKACLGLLTALLAVVVGCASEAEPVDAGASQTGSATPSDAASAGQRFPDVIEVAAEATGPGLWRFDVTISSPYDTPERYADGYRVRSVDGSTEYGVRELGHDHADEQPFTRSLSDVRIPRDVTEVVVEGRDLAHGWGGGTRTVTLPAG